MNLEPYWSLVRQSYPLTREIACSDQVLEQLGTFLSELHRFPIQQAVHLNVPAADPKDWRQNYVDFYNWVRTYSFPKMKAAEIAHFVGLNETGGKEIAERVLSFYQASSTSTFLRRINFYTAIIPFYEIQYVFIVNHEQHIVHGLQQIQESTPRFR